MKAVQLNFFSTKPALADLYAAWKEENLTIVNKFFQFADYAAKHGKKFGAKMIWERMRWEIHFSAAGDAFKCNNNWPAYLIRDWMRTRPQWAHMVETRSIRSGEGEP